MPQQPLAQVPLDSTWFWQEKGLCRSADPLLFFHPQNERGASRVRREQSAKRVCASCPVRLECADYAIRAREPYGVWGGLSEEERERILHRIEAKQFPRAIGAGLRLAGEAVNEAISERALGIAG
jgi:WhiB family transcriptional regulator, redox-sensing transcriptional regulator